MKNLLIILLIIGMCIMPASAVVKYNDDGTINDTWQNESDGDVFITSTNNSSNIENVENDKPNYMLYGGVIILVFAIGFIFKNRNN